MQNTPSLERADLVEHDARALIRYLGTGYALLAVQLEQIQSNIANQKLLDAQRLVAALQLVCDTTDDRVKRYLSGAKSRIHPKYTDGQATTSPLQLTYQPATDVQ